MLICQLTDLHLCAPGRLSAGAVDTHAMADRAFAAVAAFDPAPQAVLVTGDVADSGEAAEYEAFLALVQQHLSMPVYVIPGNHDRREPLRRVLRALPGLGGDAGFIQYVVDDLPVRLVMLDTQVPGENHGELCAERLDFLDRALTAEPDRPTLIAMHHPPFQCGIEFMDRDGLRNPDDLRAVLARHKQVDRIVCGHLHRAITGRVADIPAVAASSPCHQMALLLGPDAAGAFVLEPPAFALHRWTERDGFASHVAFVGPFPGPFPFSK